MPSTHWQKSSYCADSSNCLSVAAFPDAAIRIREIETPNPVVTTARPQFGLLMDAIKSGSLNSP
ncbi:DUF397 domain-containing protein [Streptomyces paromomycinus]|uniref:DUF397 domain-containing protein n=1 Tax=Streptomyces paromomycinus TaxID=92743 RepID=A0A401W669_STREY|nr:hypothetical protein GKJPGBOP_04493 [Streptomyces paromomycinus]